MKISLKIIYYNNSKFVIHKFISNGDTYKSLLKLKIIVQQIL